ncbi:MAG: hypothetical protein ACOCRX_08195 [Candidatus Woesearchaeota archaeon]
MDNKAPDILNELELMLKHEDQRIYFLYLLANNSSLSIDQLLKLRAADINREENIVINKGDIFEEVVLEKKTKEEFFRFLENLNKSEFLFRE